MDVGVARRVLQLEDLVEFVLHEQRAGGYVGVVLIVGLSDEAILSNVVAARVGEDSSDVWPELLRGAGMILLEVAKHCDRGVAVGAIGDGRLDGVAIVLDVVDLRIGVARHASQAI